MPTREEMINEIRASRKTQYPSRDQMIADIRSQSSAPSGISGIEKALFSVRSALEGHTSGISEPVIAHGKASGTSDALHAPYGVISDSEYGDATNSAEYKEAYKKDVDTRQKEKADNVGLDISSQVVGGLLPSPYNVTSKIFGAVNAGVTGAKGLISSSLPRATEYLSTAKGLLPSVSRIGAKTAGGLTEGALSGASMEGVRQLAERPTGFLTEGSAAEDIGTAAKFGGLISGGIRGGAQAVREGAQGAKLAAKKSLQTFVGGVKPEIMDDYLANSERINKSKSMEELKDLVDKSVLKLHDDVQKQKLTAQDAEQAIKELKANLVQSFRDRKIEGKEALSTAQELLKSAKDRAVTNAGMDLTGTIDNLKQTVINESEKATEVLGDSSRRVSIARLKGEVTVAMKQLKVGGAAAVSDDSAAAVASLQRIRGRIDSLPKDISLQEAKKLIQQLDKDIQYASKAGEFSEAGNRAKQGIRSYLDGIIKKESPEYAEAMVPVAKKAGLLSEASQAFGTENMAASKLKGIGGPTAIRERDILRRIQKETGRDFIGSVNERNLPEYQRVRDAEANLARMRRKQVDQTISKVVGESKASADLNQAKGLLSTAEQKYAPFRSMGPNSAGQTQSQGKLNQLLQGKSIENKRMFSKLSGLTGTDFEQAVKDLRVKESFGKSNTNGSRNTNIWTTMAASLGFLAGGAQGAALAVGPGAAIGGVMDKFGPQITKSILDQVIKFNKIPSVKVIQQMKIPERYKLELVKDLTVYENSINRIEKTASYRIPADNRDSK